MALEFDVAHAAFLAVTHCEVNPKLDSVKGHLLEMRKSPSGMAPKTRQRVPFQGVVD